MKNAPIAAVFVGPSLSTAVAAHLLPMAEIKIPARRGDIDSEVRAGRKIIVLIDGFLVSSLPPSPQEVARALGAGVAVFGAASLGALRAVELRGMGMRGGGWVYNAYLTRSVVADDEVVTTLSHIDYSATSVPLVRVRYALGEMLARDRISGVFASWLLDAVRSRHYTERTEAFIKEAVDWFGAGATVTEELLCDEFDIKAQDATACLERVRIFAEGLISHGSAPIGL